MLELGRDMHLLDLHSTSIWTTTTMGIYVMNIDEGDLVSLIQPGFNAKKRVVHSEEIGKILTLCLSFLLKLLYLSTHHPVLFYCMPHTYSK